MAEGNEKFWSNIFSFLRPRYLFIILLFAVLGLSFLLRSGIPIAVSLFAFFAFVYPEALSGSKISPLLNDRIGRTISSMTEEGEVPQEAEIAILPMPAKPPIHQIVFTEAASDIDDINIAASAASGVLGKSLNLIAENLQKIMAEINEDPSQFADVSRLFTYYVPEISNLLLARGALIKQKDKVKIKEIDTMIGRLASISKDFLEKVEDLAVNEIDIDLRLLDQSLAQEVVFETNIKR